MWKPVATFLILLIIGLSTLSLMSPPPPPPGPIGPYLNGIFSETAPGANSTWELEDVGASLEIPSPLRILPFPGNDDLLVLSKLGLFYRISLEGQSQEVVLDITDRSFKRGEAGTVGMVLHPEFGDPNAPDKQWLFVFYRSKPDPDEWDEKGFNRLSKFRWDEQAQTFDLNSEEILIQQYDRFTWHNGGGMFFGPDGFLYLSLGDEGADEHQAVSTQRLDGGFFSGVLRIDVDNDPSRSHPIIRQPLANANAPSGWGNTFSQGYSIPNDNPWLSPDGSHLEEFFALGLRSPYAMTYDAITDQIWLADVGSNKREEINLVEKGDNMQWPYKEGVLASENHQMPDVLIGQDKPAYFEYGRSVGSCIIGGSVYRGSRYPELYGKYLFADYVQDKIMVLTNTGSQSEPEYSVLISNISGADYDLPEGPGITGLFPQPDGHVLVSVQGEDFTVPGKILRMKRKTLVPDPPTKLSDLGAFIDLSTLSPAPGIIPYTVNAPLWSDRAVKKRWMAIPNDGTFDTADEQINFESLREWTFPEGTVFIKHFDLPLTDEPNGEVARLETRFFIIGENGQGYGLTYQWNDEGTDATLLGAGASKNFDIFENGQFAYIQTWDFPSRDQCMACHTDNAKYVLGVKTHQLNGEQHYPSLGHSMNQLDYLNQVGIFHRNIGEGSDYMQAYPIDDESADLELRIRSYLDANCASCHRLGGVTNVSLDFRFMVPLRLQNLINLPTQSENSDPDRLLVKPGYHAESELWIRDASNEEDRMPPIGRNLVDDVYVDALAEWIDQLPADAGSIRELLLYPNPSSGWVGLRLSDDWEPPFLLTIHYSSGQVIEQKTFNSHSYFLDLSNHPTGIYLLAVSAGDQREIQRLVVQ